MRQIILDFPKQFKAGLNAAKNIKIDGKFDNVVVCGMGGSAMPGALLGYLLPAIRYPLQLHVHRNYNLPPQANKNSLIVCISYSGDTEETISAYEEAIKNGYKVAGIATGGKLGEFCDKNKTPWAKIPSEPKIPPRCGVGYQFAALIGILINAIPNDLLRRHSEQDEESQKSSGFFGLRPQNDAEDSTKIKDWAGQILNLAQTLNSEDFENQGKELAKKIAGKIPIIYSSEKWGALAYSWKTNLNENSKIHAFYNVFPEFNHNELNGYAKIDNPEKFYVIIMRDSEDHPRVIKRMEAAADIIKSKNTEVDFIEIQGENTLEKIFNTYILGLWASYWLALETGVDPLPVEIIEEFKSRIAE